MFLIRKLKRFINRLTKGSQEEQCLMTDILHKYAVIGDSFCNDINLRLEDPVEGRKYFTIGNDCIVSGSFIFE